MASFTAPPPLPLDIRDRILAHLLPPSPPLPHDLLSRTFLERLTFLPPDPADLDAHLTPLRSSSSSPHPLTDALQQLAGSLTIGDTQYAHDGEMAIASTLLAPEHGDGAVEVSFQHEGGDKGRGWVYSGAKLGASAFDWRNDPADVSYAGYQDAPDDYWAGFTPPSEHAELHEHDEDDYWAQYGAGVPDSEPEPAARDEPVTPPTANITAPDPAATLSLLLQGLDAPSERSASPQSASRRSDGSVLEQKIRSKTRAQLMRAWTEYSAGDAEAVYDWLRLGREIADRPSWTAGTGTGYADARTAVLMARLEAAKDLHEMLGEEGEAFWRLVEEAIRIHTNPVGDGQQEYEQS